MSDKMLSTIKKHLEAALAACEEGYEDDDDEEEEEDDDEDEDEDEEEESPKKKKSSKVDLAIAFMGPKDKK